MICVTDEATNSDIDLMFPTEEPRDAMAEPILIREWESERFHERVLELESRGYVARRDSYTITPEMNPETGFIIHLYSIEMSPPEC